MGAEGWIEAGVRSWSWELKWEQGDGAKVGVWS